MISNQELRIKHDPKTVFVLLHRIVMNTPLAPVWYPRLCFPGLDHQLEEGRHVNQEMLPRRSQIELGAPLAGILCDN